MNNDVIITCAVTGAGDTTSRSNLVPITPRQVADAAIEAAKAGAAVVHVHVRDPETGQGSRDPALFREAVDMIRDSGVDLIINLTAGMGGDWVPSEADPSLPGPGTDMIGPEARLAHVVECKPDICSLDCGIGNLSWCYRHQVATAGGIARAGDGAGDDDIVIHLAFPSKCCLVIDL